MLNRVSRFSCVLSALVFAVCALTGPASAEIQTINFTARLDDAGLEVQNLRAGDTIAGSFSYDDAAPDENPGTAGTYPLTGASMTLTIHTAGGSEPLTITTTGPDHGRIDNGGRIAVHMRLPMPDGADGTFIELSDDGFVRSDSVSEVTRVAREGVFATAFFSPSLFMVFTGDGPWGSCEPRCPFAEAGAELTDFSLQPRPLCPIGGDNPPVCACLRDESLKEYRCAFLDPSFLAISRIPWPIPPGREYLLNWEILPLTQLDGPISVQLQGANIAKPIDLSFIGKNRKVLESRKVRLTAPKEPTDLPGTTILSYQGRSWKIDTTIPAVQFGKAELPVKELKTLPWTIKQAPKPQD